MPASPIAGRVAQLEAKPRSEARGEQQPRIPVSRLRAPPPRPQASTPLRQLIAPPRQSAPARKLLSPPSTPPTLRPPLRDTSALETSGWRGGAGWCGGRPASGRSVRSPRTPHAGSGVLARRDRRCRRPATGAAAGNSGSRGTGPGIAQSSLAGGVTDQPKIPVARTRQCLFFRGTTRTRQSLVPAAHDAAIAKGPGHRMRAHACRPVNVPG